MKNEKLDRYLTEKGGLLKLMASVDKNEMEELKKLMSDNEENKGEK